MSEPQLHLELINMIVGYDPWYHFEYPANKRMLAHASECLRYKTTKISNLRVLRLFADRVDWKMVSRTLRLPEWFIREHSDRVDWTGISSYQSLSERFIREHSDRVDWTGISSYQILSEEFIREHDDKVNWTSILHNQSFSREFGREYAHLLYRFVQFD